MNPNSRIGPEDSDIVVFAKGGRDFRYDRLTRGEETPREFFYGFFDLAESGLSASMLSSAGATPGALGAVADRFERGFASVTALGVRPFSARLSRKAMNVAKVAISFTDGCSLSLGLGLGPKRRRPILIGGFHGISDIEARAPLRSRAIVKSLIARSLAGLDHAFFFGPADRRVAIERYGLRPEKSSVIKFGIDSDFWRPLADAENGDFAFAVGQDQNRDYDCLVAASGNHPVRIVTRQKIGMPAGVTNVTVTPGDFFGSQSLTDEDLRQIYNNARVVVVPLKDVWQPTGYSVTLQAMSCARPVILSNIRGLWAPDLLQDNVNCILVPPGDAAALGEAIGRVRSDPELAARLGRAARQTVLEYFGIDKIGDGTVALARLGLDLHAKKCAA